MIAVISLSILAVCLLGALIYRERAHDTQTQALLDRIEAPQASQAAAFTRLLPPPPEPEPEIPHYVRTTDTDLQLLEGLG